MVVLEGGGIGVYKTRCSGTATWGVDGAVVLGLSIQAYQSVAIFKVYFSQPFVTSSRDVGHHWKKLMPEKKGLSYSELVVFGKQRRLNLCFCVGQRGKPVCVLEQETHILPYRTYFGDIVLKELRPAEKHFPITCHMSHFQVARKPPLLGYSRPLRLRSLL